jgi:membrane protease YdiL (CAAX protease family)
VISMIAKIFFSSVIACIAGLVIVGGVSWLFLFGLLGLDYSNPVYGVVGGFIGSVYYSWYRYKQKSR